MSETSADMSPTAGEKEDSEPASWESTPLDKLPTSVIPINSLLLDDSPRQGGANDDHVQVLAESEDQLPPIVVHGQSMRVIDGIHRVRAAAARGDKKIEAKIYHGKDDDAFVLAVWMNIAHGLPLTHADRTAAAARIIRSHPQWSDRRIATVTGLAAGTVGRVRRRLTVQNAQSVTRVGKDGRVRPINSAAGRLKASELLAEKPTASIRAIAKEAGVSPSTVYEVRRRLHAGQQPTTERQRATAASRLSDVRPPHRDSGALKSAGSVNVAAVLTNLKKDPSLQSSDVGRSLLQWLERYALGMAALGKIVKTVPDHCTSSVAKLARWYARGWSEVATELEKRWPHRSP